MRSLGRNFSSQYCFTEFICFVRNINTLQLYFKKIVHLLACVFLRHNFSAQLIRRVYGFVTNMIAKKQHFFYTLKKIAIMFVYIKKSMKHCSCFIVNSSD